MSAPAWMAAARCRTADPDVFFTDGRELEAKTICRGCPVRSECADYSVGIEWGVWGGVGARERRKIKRAAA